METDRLRLLDKDEMRGSPEKLDANDIARDCERDMAERRSLREWADTFAVGVAKLVELCRLCVEVVWVKHTEVLLTLLNMSDVIMAGAPLLAPEDRISGDSVKLIGTTGDMCLLKKPK